MITDIESRKLVVISDLHLGNPFSQAKRKTIDFLNWSTSQGFDVVINGDGFEIAQVSFSKIARDVPEVFHALKTATKTKNIYYVVGNHDIVFENFLNDWGGFKVAPFLNVNCGSRRLRIEHGHLYDPFFVKNPELYEFFTWLAGFGLKLHPELYRLWIRFEKLRSRFFLNRGPNIAGEHPNFSQAARELLNRGFDTVIFGHTHHVGHVQFSDEQNYFNPGSWMIGSTYVEIIDGVSSLKTYTTQQAAIQAIS